MSDSTHQIHLPLAHPAHDALQATSRALRERLARALAIEYDWRYHDGPEWAARYWQAFGDLAARGAPAGQSVQRALAREDWPRLSAAEADDVRTIFRSLLLLVHPEVSPEGYLKIGDGLWQTILRAYRAGDRSGLVTAWSETRARVRASGWPDAVVALRREHDRLAQACAAADQRLARMRHSFPFNMRDKLGDEAWVARQRRRMGPASATHTPQPALADVS